MIYSTEIKNMCSVAKGANHGPAQSLKRANGFRLKRLRTFLAILMVSAGVLHSRVLAIVS